MAQNPNDNRDQGKIEKLEEKLYARDEKAIPKRERNPLYPKRYSVDDDWEREEPEKKGEGFHFGSKFFRRVFWVSFIFFFVSLAIATFAFFRTTDILPPKITVIGPSTAKGGEEITLQYVIHNPNSTPLELADLIITYPEGTRSSVGATDELLTHRKSFGTILPGTSVNESVRNVFYGNENSDKKVGISLEYRLANSNAVFEKEEGYTVTLTSAPINITVETVRETSSGQSVEFKVNVSSNAESAVDNVYLEAEYPFGFTLSDSSVPAVFGEKVWRLGTISPGESKEIIIKGQLAGQGGETRVFRFKAGSGNPDGSAVAVAYGNTNSEIVLNRPFMDIALEVNRDSSQNVVLRKTEDVSVVLSWKNNFPNKITDGEISILFSGALIDETTMSVGNGGFYRLSDNTIVWNERQTPELAVIGSGESGLLRFQFSIHPRFSAQASQIRNPEINMEVNVSGQRVSEAGVPESVESTTKKQVKIETGVQFASRAVYFSGPLQNSGPLPPKLGNETTYTVVWTALNSLNDVEGARVTSKLPSYMRWVGTKVPFNENLTYNSSTGDIVWDIGKLSAGQGVTSQVKEVSFQVALEPALDHLAKSPDILLSSIFTGRDTFTRTNIEQVFRALTTDLRSDPQFTQDMSRVVQ